MIKVKIQCGKFFISPEEIKEKGLVRDIMVDILGCQPDDCRDKKVYLSLVKLNAQNIIKRLNNTRKSGQNI